MKMKEYLLNDFFDISTTKSVDKNKIEFKNNAPYDFIGRTSTDWGVQGTVDKLDFAPNPKDSFSLVQVGETVALWREKEWYASQNLFLLKPKVPKIKDTFLYFQAVINKEMSSYGNAYNSYPTMKSLNKTSILLPVKITLIPDFESLEILAGGGTDMSNIDTSSWKEFKVSEVFGKAKLGKYHNPTDLIENKNGYPYICASNQNNGINSQMPRVNGLNLVLTPAKIIAWGKQCPMFTYHDERCVTSQGMYYLDLTDYSENVALFICSALSKACKGKYSYSNCLIGSVMDEIIIKLPVKESEEIDWNYMQERVAELEQERVAELEQYLIAAGLNDYELTDEDKEVLEMYRKVA